MFSPIDAEEDGEAADGARLVAAGRRRRRRLSDVQRGARQSAVQLQRQARRLLRRRRGPVSGTEFQFPPDLIARCEGYRAIFRCRVAVFLFPFHFTSLQRDLVPSFIVGLQSRGERCPFSSVQGSSQTNLPGLRCFIIEVEDARAHPLSLQSRKKPPGTVYEVFPLAS